MDGRIYLVSNTLNEKLYVGQTIAKDRRGHGHLITKAYKAHGRDKFSYQIICSNIKNQNTLNYLERFWIKTYDSMYPNGYNLESGGNHGKSEYLNGENHPFFGKKHSEETKQKIRASMMGRKHTSEAKANMKAAIRPVRERDNKGKFK